MPATLTYSPLFPQNTAEFLRPYPCRHVRYAATHPVQPLKGLPGTRVTDVSYRASVPAGHAGRGVALSYRALAPGGAGFCYRICTGTSEARPTAHYSLLTAHSSYTFSAKERDPETGLSYFGSRYYSSDLSVWLSVDPMSDKYPSLSPYVYCADNPVKLVDPNGEDYEVLIDNSNKTITIKATYYVTKDTKEGMEMGFRYFTLQQQNLSYSDGSILDSGLINEYFQQTMMRTERRLTPDNISSPNAYTKKTNWENVGIGYFKTN